MQSNWLQYNNQIAMRHANQSDSQDQSPQLHRIARGQIHRQPYYWHADIEVSCSVDFANRDYDDEEQLSHITYEHSSDHSKSQHSFNSEDEGNQINNPNQEESSAIYFSSFARLGDGANYTLSHYAERRQFNGLKPEDIAHLPKMAWSNHNMQLNSEQKCGICLNHYELNEDLRVLGCLHRFHQHCVDTWLGGNRTCPSCRHVIDISRP